MILSYAHKFIFLKTKKTAGSSVELALGGICGPDDVVTPVAGKGDVAKTDHQARNFEISADERPWFWRIKQLLGYDERSSGLVYWNHMTAEQVRNRAGPKLFDAFKKVTIERNPWDREVSYYYWQYKKASERPPFDEFVLTDRWRKPVNNFQIYSLKNEIIADVVLRYETLDDDYRAFVHSLGLDDVPELPNAKNQFRPSKARNYREFYTDQTREAVARIYRREIEAFGYQF